MGLPNLFKVFVFQKVYSKTPASHEKKKGEIATVCYIFLMLVISVGLIAYYSTRRSLEEVSVVNPSPNQFTNLVIDGRRPACECSNSAVSMAAITNVTVSQNELCNLIPHLRSRCDAAVRSTTMTKAARERECQDFPLQYARSMFYGLDMLCNISREAIEVGKTTFEATQLVTPDALDAGAMEVRVGTLWTAMREQLVNGFLQPLSLMRSLDRMDRPLTAFTVGSNQLDSSDDPLAFVSMNGTGGIAFHPTFNELSPGRKCNCFVDYDCEATVTMGPNDRFTLKCSLFESIMSFPIARLLLGAPTRRRAQATEQQVQAALAAATAPLMQSQRQQQRQWLRQAADAVSSRGRRVSEKSLEYCCKTPKLCTVDKDCFQLSPCCAEARTLASGGSSDSGSETVLDGGAPPPVTTGSVRDAVKQAFISEFTARTDWPAYFRKCAPAKCVYVESLPPAFFDVLTTVLGLIGGISVVVRALLTLMLSLWRAPKHDNDGLVTVKPDPRARPVGTVGEKKDTMASLEGLGAPN